MTKRELLTSLHFICMFGRWEIAGTERVYRSPELTVFHMVNENQRFVTMVHKTGLTLEEAVRFTLRKLR
jgi:hypothetical protein